MASSTGRLHDALWRSALGFGAGIAVIVCAQLTSAQYLKHPDPRIPRTADGKPNLAAPLTTSRRETRSDRDLERG